MARPWKDPEIQQKIKDWVEENPERRYTTKYEDIAVEAGVSLSSLYRYFLLVVAAAEEMLPSEVKAKREAHRGVSPWGRRLSDDEITKIQQLHEEGHDPLDIVYLTGRSLSTVEKIKKRRDAE